MFLNQHPFLMFEFIYNMYVYVIYIWVYFLCVYIKKLNLSFYVYAWYSPADTATPARSSWLSAHPFCTPHHITKSSKAWFPHHYNDKNYIMPEMCDGLKIRDSILKVGCKMAAPSTNGHWINTTCCCFYLSPYCSSPFASRSFFNISKSYGEELRFTGTTQSFR